MEHIKTNYSNLEHIALQVFREYDIDNPQFDRQMIKEEFVYYVVALFWVRLLDIKAKKCRVGLTDQEKSIHEAMAEITVNIPQPIYAYLTQMGDIEDEKGILTEIEIPALPIIEAGGFGGYHAAEINHESHYLFEEVPTLGIAADAIIAASTSDENPVQPVRVKVPIRAVVTRNLCCYSQNIGPRRIEIRQKLEGQGITATEFPEYVKGTRFNFRYLQTLSDLISEQKQKTFRIEKVAITNLSRVSKDLGLKWPWWSMQVKEFYGRDNIVEQSESWSCIKSDPEVPWIMSEAWNENRSIRRNLPPGTEKMNMKTEAIRGIIRGMVITRR